jgi:riboflavin kinase/FMN adenylyltransferase
MQLIRGLYNLKPEHKNCVVTIGNFDGMHLGHKVLIDRLTTAAKKLHVPSMVITFEPQPNEYFLHGKTPARLTKFREKLLALQQLGVNRILVLRFDTKLAAMTAEDFVKKILVDALNCKFLIVGDDFRFGKDRKGDYTLLNQMAEQYSFILEQLTTFAIAEDRVSSTRIRKALEAGDLVLTEKLLGRPFCLSGRVAHGDKRGRIIGFPTANIFLHRKAVPILGVYAVKIYGLRPNNHALFGVANVGNRPTVDGTRSLLEVHIFDFAETIYGRHVTVEFVHKLRDEKKYASFELLKEQIFRDATDARTFFKLKVL